MERIVFDGDNDASYAATGGDLVSGLEFIDHGLPAFLAGLLRTYQNKIHHRKHEDHDEEERRAARTAGGLEQIKIEHALNHLGCLLQPSVYISATEIFLLDCHRW